MDPDVRCPCWPYRKRADLLDRLHDEGFPDDPYLSGRLRAEIERLSACGRPEGEASLSGSSKGVES